MLRYQLFPRSFGVSKEIIDIINCFENHYDKIKSPEFDLSSDGVLKILTPDFLKLNFQVELSKASADKIKVPVLFSYNNKIDKSFNADALSADGRIVVEVEAGRGFRNNQFLKDIFQACMMPDVEYLVLAVRNEYSKTDDFTAIYQYLETLYINARLKLPLKGIVLIGY
jgi:hypothetical protein